MRTLLPDPPPAPFAQLLAERELRGADRRDEVWEGVRHMNPPASHEHERLVSRLHRALGPLADAAGLELTGSVGIGESEDYRVPDLAVHRPGAAEQWHPTAALCVEVLSPGGETWEKLDFYASHHIDELVIVDPATRRVHWRALATAGYEPVERSAVIDLAPAWLARELGWPPGLTGSGG